jgi:hypothetical protein
VSTCVWSGRRIGYQREQKMCRPNRGRGTDLALRKGVVHLEAALLVVRIDLGQLLAVVSWYKVGVWRQADRQTDRGVQRGRRPPHKQKGGSQGWCVEAGRQTDRQGGAARTSAATQTEGGVTYS